MEGEIKENGPLRSLLTDNVDVDTLSGGVIVREGVGERTTKRQSVTMRCRQWQRDIRGIGARELGCLADALKTPRSVGPDNKH